jgi:isoprenylcysteine carboxyl methyltransferase (ICMT) family protein YpbQ
MTKAITTTEEGGTNNTRAAGAFLLDFFTVFFVSAYAAAAVNGTTSGHFIDQKTALIAVSVTVLYFVIGKLTGGTFWQRIIRIK